MMSANSRIRFALQIVRVFVQYTISLSSLCKFIWRHWTSKMLVRYICRVWVRLSIFSQLSNIQYVGLCVFSLPTPFEMIERIHTLCLIIIIKTEVWTITHYLGFGHETMVCAVCLSIFLWKNNNNACLSYTASTMHAVAMTNLGASASADKVPPPPPPPPPHTHTHTLKPEYSVSSAVSRGLKCCGYANVQEYSHMGYKHCRH